MQTANEFAKRMNTSMDTKFKVLDYINGDNVKVLDFGCGSGLVGIEFAKNNPSSHVTLVDSYDDMLTVATDNAKGLNNVTTKSELVGVEKFDYIILSSVLHEELSLSEKQLIQTLTHMGEMLNDGGKIIIRDGLLPNENERMKLKVVNEAHLKDFMHAANNMTKINNFLLSIQDRVYVRNGFISGSAFVIKNFVNKYTWGTASLHREAFETFLAFDEANLNKYAKASNLEVDTYEEFLDEDYFNHLNNIVQITEKWNTHVFCTLKKGE